ncbi:hypothetical protein E3N88_30498 [Mikania micrantha]|uniref:Reverse transcriptase domain-containing protein n=1 Tax=Mikania micrantha TaxID=192012 RepID=A0A5N6MPS5_9ASTR|nr:hypothetical protein E3N88_30498 [Mikania micrantha]
MIETRLRRETQVIENQFGFMPGRLTTEAIHILRRIMERYREKKRDLHMVFTDLEKAYDSVPRQVIWDSLERRSIPWRYIELIKDTYTGLEIITTGKSSKNRERRRKPCAKRSSYAPGIAKRR